MWSTNRPCILIAAYARSWRPWRALRDLPGSDVAHALDRVGLSRAADHRVAHCSQGMRRRADLARAALGRQLLLLDEADAGLDPEAAGVVDGLVADVRGRDGVVITVGHDSSYLAASCDVIWSLRGASGGRSVTFGGQVRMVARAEAQVEARGGEVFWVAAPFGLAALLVLAMAVGADLPQLRQRGWASTGRFCCCSVRW